MNRIENRPLIEAASILAIVLAWSFVVGQPAVAKLAAGQSVSDERSKTAKIILKWEGPRGTGPKELRLFVADCLEKYDFEILNEADTSVDLELTIRVTAEAILADYGTGSFRRVYDFAGASLRGNLIAKVKMKEKKWGFTGQVDPPESKYLRFPAAPSREDAPFYEALRNGDFEKSLIKATRWAKRRVTN